jgi:hypothetical protein
MKRSHFEVQVHEQVQDAGGYGLPPVWDTVAPRDTPEEAEKLRNALVRAYGAEHVRVRKVTTQEVYETIPGRTALGHKRVETSQGNVDVSVTNEHESVIRLPGRGVVIYLNTRGVEISHPVGANATFPASAALVVDAPLMPTTRGGLTPNQRHAAKVTVSDPQEDAE